MSDYNRKSGRNFDSRDRQMHDAVCAKCGGNCKVPFAPTSGKPVYCSDCFDSQNSGDNRRGGNKRSFSDRPNRPAPVDYAPQLEAISNKLDKILEMLVIQKMKEKAAEYSPADSETEASE